ncbi:MAG: PilZ domain-containing protein [Candidatus Acidiferrales bacterium]
MRLFTRAVPHINAAADWLPRSQRFAVERRLHPRALLSLPVRLRWLGPLGLEAETSVTLDAGRGGVLVSSREPRVQGTLVWVTFPFDAAASTAGPETSAQVARSKTTPSGGYLAGIAFANGNSQLHQASHAYPPVNAEARNNPVEKDRRRHARTRLALPVHVCGADPSWPDDAMTMDISHTGLLFCTLRIYEQDELLTLALPRSPWISAGSRRARIARIASHPSEPRLLCVGVEFFP